MPDYIPYTVDEYQPDAPATALHFARWFQNWEAGFQGAAGAPKLCIGALQRLSPGSQIRSRFDGQIAAGLATSGRKFAFMQAGTIRITFEHRNGNGNGTALVARTRNGVITDLASWDNGSSYNTRTIDVPVLPGDSITVYNPEVTGTSYLRNVRAATNGEDLWPGIETPLEGNTYG